MGPLHSQFSEIYSRKYNSGHSCMISFHTFHLKETNWLYIDKEEWLRENEEEGQRKVRGHREKAGEWSKGKKGERKRPI